MGLKYENLDLETRRLMVQEIEADMASGLYLSSYLTETGKAMWPVLLMEAAIAGTDDTLAEAISGWFLDKYERSNGVIASVPKTAHETLSQGQFNMYYMRALARRASERNIPVTVYRARLSANPRPESLAMLDRQYDPNVILESLRRTKGVQSEVGLPMPNSGLSLRFG